MADITEYTGKITSEHAVRPKFMAIVEAVANCFVDNLNVTAGMPLAFDLDSAIGVQLDEVGLWVGVTRYVAVPITDVYFGFDTPGVGFDQGVWLGPFDSASGVTSLDDDTYRLLLRARIAANHWDGTLAGSAEILNQVFQGDSRVFIEDHQDMSITIGVSGSRPSSLILALLATGCVPLKPQSVRVDYCIVSTVDGQPLFGFDMENEYTSGFDAGAWGMPL